MICSQARAQLLATTGVFIDWLLGIDVGATKVALALADRQGRVRARERRLTEATGDPSRDVARLLEDARRLLETSGVTPGEVACVGVSAPGPLDVARGAVLRPPNLPGWDDVPLRDTLAEGLGRPVQLENDANAAVLAEWRFGAGRGCADVAFLTMSTGVGAGLVLDGRLYRGGSGNAGEIGHLPVEWGGEPCACGKRGCLEAYVGGAAWTRRLRAHTPEASRVLALAGAREAILPQHVVAAAGEGDGFAREEFARFNHYLARGVAALAYVLAPEVVILGTIAAAAGEELCFAPLRQRVAELVWPELAGGLRIVPSALGPELGELAGVCVALQASEAP